ncbi:phosphotransferase [Streptomyces phaeochromogenes]
MTDIGATSASITRALEGFDAPALHQSHHWDVTRSDRAIRSCLDDHPQLAGEPYVWTVLEWFKEVQSKLTGLPRALVHHDLNDNNRLVDTNDGQQHVSGVLDFNDALFSVRVAEPAIAGAYAMLRKEDPLRALGLAVAGYQQVQSLSADELEVVYPLAVARFCVQVLTLTARSQSNPTEYGTRCMEHTLPTLGRLLEIEPAAATTYLREARGDVAQAKVSRVRARATRTRAGRREAGRAGGATLPQQRQTETRDRTQSSRSPHALVTRRTFRVEMPGMLRPDYGLGNGHSACRTRSVASAPSQRPGFPQRAQKQ